MQIRLGGALRALVFPFSKLAFWRKPVAADAAAPPAGDEEVAAADTPPADNPEPPAPKPGLLARFKMLWRRRPAESAMDPDAVEPDAPTAAETAADEAEAPASKPPLMARIKALFRRQRAPEGEDGSEDERAEATTENAEDATATEAPPSLLQKLRRKRVWVPALALLLLGLIGALTSLMLRATHETQRLQKELQAAKHQLALPPAAAPRPPVTAAAPQPQVEAPKLDPAFHIVGAKAPEAESGLNAGDCVVSDREQVAANLKRCIESFNAALASSSKK